MLQINDLPGRFTVSEMRTYFERSVNGMPVLKSNTPLGPVVINGKFSHYMDGDTDNLWIGFALGMRAAERIHLARNAGHQIHTHTIQAIEHLQAGEYAPLPEPDATTVGLDHVWNRHSMRSYADAVWAVRSPAGESLSESQRDALNLVLSEAEAQCGEPEPGCVRCDAVALLRQHFGITAVHDDIGPLTSKGGT